MRRATLALAAALVVAGCLGGGAERVRVAGSPATVSPGAAADAGYERVALENRTLNATITVTLMGDVQGRESQPVRATIPVARYRGPGGAVAAVASSPFVEVIEHPSKGGDPLGTLAPAELVAFVQSTYDPADLRKTGQRQVSVLGSEAALVTYRGSATRTDGRVTVRVLRVRDDGDVVTLVVVHEAGADARVDALLDGIRH